MIAEKMKPLVANNSAIRTMFEEGGRMKAIYGEENVYDFSLGNPNVPTPPEVKQAILDILEEEEPLRIHGYMNNAGFPETRKAIADSLNRRFGTAFGTNNIIMTVGAASGLNVALKTILNPGDEVITFAPYFLEYNAYVNNFDGVLIAVPADTETFQPNLTALEERICAKTRAVIINTPHNPTGVIYTEETLKALAEILEKKQQEYGAPIFLISDEPYRELAYDGAEVPWVTKYYANTIVGYSYSKSLALPGERIGYVLVPDEIDDSKDIYAAVCGAGRALGYVCAPSMMQHVLERCTGLVSDLNEYKEKRDLIYRALTDMGFTCIHPDGAFYLFVRSPIADANAFSEKAKEFNLLLVPADSFGTPGFVRIAYCVSTDMIKRSLPAFEKLAACYK